MTTVAVVTGGDPVPVAAVRPTDRFDLVVAADSGLDHAERLGLVPDVVVGDFDSVSEASLERFSGPTERHPVAKDATDLELALRLAVARQPDRIVVLGGHGGRLDHWLANALVLTTIPPSIGVEWRAGEATIHVVHSRVEVTGTPGSTISLIPVGGTTTGVTTDGLRWPLHAAELTTGSTLGVSNEFVADTATIEVETGTLLVVVPGPEDRPAGQP